jgi:hypothetical protein
MSLFQLMNYLGEPDSLLETTMDEDQLIAAINKFKQEKQAELEEDDSYEFEADEFVEWFNLNDENHTCDRVWLTEVSV